VEAFEILKASRKTRSFGKLQVHVFYVCCTFEKKLLGFVFSVYKVILYARQLPVCPCVRLSVDSEFVCMSRLSTPESFVDFC
jgi:hypothetical protein